MLKLNLDRAVALLRERMVDVYPTAPLHADVKDALEDRPAGCTKEKLQVFVQGNQNYGTMTTW